MESILIVVICNHLKLLFYRRKRYVHRCKLDWDVHSSSGRYVRKHCKPLKVRGIIVEADPYSQSAPVLIKFPICMHLCSHMILKNKLLNDDVYLLAIHKSSAIQSFSQTALAKCDPCIFFTVRL